MTLALISILLLTFLVLLILGANPAHTTRGSPQNNTGGAAYKMPDGYPTKIAFSNLSTAGACNIGFFEKTLNPPGVDGGDAIDTTTMLNVNYRTKSPRSLKTLTEINITAAYDPDINNTASVGSSLFAQINIAQSVTFYYPDGTYQDFYGFIKDYKFKEHKEGEFPEVDIMVVPTNWDPVGQVEQGPVFHAAGT